MRVSRTIWCLALAGTLTLSDTASAQYYEVPPVVFTGPLSRCESERGRL